MERYQEGETADADRLKQNWSDEVNIPHNISNI